MFLVAQANGLAHDTAADGADFLGDLYKGAHAVFVVEARVWLGSDLTGFRVGSRIASEVGGIEVVFSRDAGQSEQRIPVGAGQRGEFRKVHIQTFLDEFVFR